MVLHAGEMISFGVGSFGGWRYWGDRVGFFSRLPVSGAIAICDEGWRDILSTGGSAVKIL